MKKQSIYETCDTPIPQRVADLLDQLTLEEKQEMMVHQWPGVERLGIPEYSWLNECLHGVARAGTATVFPQAIGMAASWNTDLMYKVATAISDEARAKHHESVRMGDRGMYKGLTFYSPNINIFRDPRWGRGHETYGEDPYLTGRMAVAYIKGMQGEDPRYLKTAACAKHYAVHSGPEGQRMTFDAHPGHRDLYETYLPAFRAAVTEGKVVSVMSAYNRLFGEPCCSSHFLNQEVLRDQWGFEGFVVSDGGAFDFVHDHHMVTKGPAETVATSFKGGCDMELGDVCVKGLPAALASGALSEQDLDQALSRTLTQLFRLGIFDPDEKVPYASIPYEVVGCSQHQDLSLEMARQSIVLLKNDGVLPLSATDASIAVCGPNADSREVLLGNYNGTPSRTITALEGLTRRAEENESRVWYAQGCDLTNQPVFFAFGPKDRNLTEAVAAAKRSQVAVLFVGLDPSMEGENGDPDASETDVGGDRRSLDLPSCQEDLIRAVLDTGTPTVVVMFGGSPITAPWIYEQADAVIQAFYPGERGGQALAEIIFGDVNPAGRMPITIPRSLDQIPPFAHYDMTGRTYRFMKESPFFRFGHGLSYTTFAYADLQVNTQKLRAGDDLDLTVRVENTGTRDGDEVIQIYVRDIEASVPVPQLHLEAFRRIRLKAGESRTEKFTLSPTAWMIYLEDGTSMVEAGEFKVFVGGGQPDADDPGCGVTVQVSAE